jgi:hypothetical protein
MMFEQDRRPCKKATFGSRTYEIMIAVMEVSRVLGWMPRNAEADATGVILRHIAFATETSRQSVNIVSSVYATVEGTGNRMKDDVIEYQGQ